MSLEPGIVLAVGVGQQKWVLALILRVAFEGTAAYGLFGKRVWPLIPSMESIVSTERWEDCEQYFFAVKAVEEGLWPVVGTLPAFSDKSWPWPQFRYGVFDEVAEIDPVTLLFRRFVSPRPDNYRELPHYAFKIGVGAAVSMAKVLGLNIAHVPGFDLVAQNQRMQKMRDTGKLE